MWMHLLNHQVLLIMQDYKISRGGEVVTRQAHNLKIGGANPSPATSLLSGSPNLVMAPRLGRGIM
jgi:hypothetical protein